MAWGCRRLLQYVHAAFWIWEVQGSDWALCRVFQRALACLDATKHEAWDPNVPRLRAQGLTGSTGLVPS